MSDPLDIMDYDDEIREYQRLRQNIAETTDGLNNAERNLTLFRQMLERGFRGDEDSFSIHISGYIKNGRHRSLTLKINEIEQFDPAFRQELIRRIKLSMIDDVDRRIKFLKECAKQYGGELEEEVTEETDEIPF